VKPQPNHHFADQLSRACAIWAINPSRLRRELEQEVSLGEKGWKRLRSGFEPAPNRSYAENMAALRHLFNRKPEPWPRFAWLWQPIYEELWQGPPSDLSPADYLSLAIKHRGELPWQVTYRANLMGADLTRERLWQWSSGRKPIDRPLTVVPILGEVLQVPIGPLLERI